MSNPYQHPLLFNKNTAPPDAVYIGRGSNLGNPYILGKHGNRDQVCDKFEKYRLPKIPKHVLESVRGKKLWCFCSSPDDPNAKRCHGLSILAELERTA